MLFRDFSLREPDNRHHTFPFFSHWIDSLRTYGALDPWNPYIWGGTSAVGQPSVALNPILYGLLYLSKPNFVLAMTLHAGLELWLAACGFYLLCRRLGFEAWRATLGGALYVGSTSAIVTIAFYGTFFHFAVYPWALWILLTPQRRTSKISSLFLVGLFYLQLTYGQLQFTQYLLVVLLLSLVWIFREEVVDRKRALKELTLGFSLAALLAAHLLVPFLEFTRLVPDRVATDWWGFTQICRSSLYYLVHLILPEIFWDPAGWWPPGWGVWESLTVYVGSLYSLLFIFSFRRLWIRDSDPPFARRWNLFAIGLVLLCATRVGGLALVALHGGREIPFARAGHLLLFPLLFTSLIELKRVLENRREAAKFFILVALAIGLLLIFRLPAVLNLYVTKLFEESSQRVLPALSWLAPFLETHRERFIGYQSQKLIELATAAALVLLLAWLPRKATFRRVIGSALVVLSAVGLVKFHHWARPKATDPYPYAQSLAKENPVLTFLKNSDRENYYLHYILGNTDQLVGLTPNENATYAIPSINGYTNLVPRRNELEPPYFRISYGRTYSSTMLKLLSIKYSLAPETAKWLKPTWRDMAAVLHYDRYQILEYPGALARFYFPRQVDWDNRASMVNAMQESNADPLLRTVAMGRQSSYTLAASCAPRYAIVDKYLSERELSVENPCPTSVWFALHMPLHPWWRLYLDGSLVPYTEANVLHRLVEVPPGKHSVSLKCKPVSWWVGLGISGLTALLLLSWVFLRRKL